MICDFSKAKIVVAFDSDFLYAHPYALRYARDFANGRRVIEADGARMNRFYAAEPTPTITGSNADHRIAVAAQGHFAVGAKNRRSSSASAVASSDKVLKTRIGSMPSCAIWRQIADKAL